MLSDDLSSSAVSPEKLPSQMKDLPAERRRRERRREQIAAAAATAEINGDGRERPVGLRRFGSKRLGMRSVAVELADLADLSELAASGAASTQKGAGCG